MGHRHTAGLLGIIVKIRLRVHVRIVADDLDGVLVRAYRAVRAEPPELTVYGPLRSRNERSAKRKGKVGHIIHDTDGELLLLGVVKYRNHLSRRGVLGTKAVTSGEDRSLIKLRAL